MKIIYGICICLVFFSCKKKEIPIPPVIEVNPNTPSSGTYKYGNESIQEMEIRIPSVVSAETPLLMVVHGGGWIGGDKNELYNYFTLLRDAFPNALVANVNYRLCQPGIPIISEQLADIHTARNWFSVNFPNWNGKTYLLGYSAGSHLAMMYSFTNYDGKIGGVINLMGHADLTIPDYINSNPANYYLNNVVGSTSYTSDPQLWENNSPIFHVSSVSPPVLSFYAGLDGLVPSIQGQRLHDTLDHFGIMNTMRFYPNDGHFDWSLETSNSMQQDIVDFIRLFE